jgi:hypothetical protein
MAMSEDFEKNKDESGEIVPESPEEMEAAIEEETALLSEQMEELESNLDSVDFDSMPEEERKRTYEQFKDMKEQVTLAAQTALAGSAGLIALGMLNAAMTGVSSEQVQGFFHGGLASGAVAAAVFAIGHTVNKIKSWQA